MYYQECGQDQPFRCYAGDLSGRLGTISIGAERQVFVDSNLPLGKFVYSINYKFSVFIQFLNVGVKKKF